MLDNNKITQGSISIPTPKESFTGQDAIGLIAMIMQLQTEIAHLKTHESIAQCEAVIQTKEDQLNALGAFFADASVSDAMSSSVVTPIIKFLGRINVPPVHPDDIATREAMGLQ